MNINSKRWKDNTFLLYRVFKMKINKNGFPIYGTYSPVKYGILLAFIVTLIIKRNVLKIVILIFEMEKFMQIKIILKDFSQQ